MTNNYIVKEKIITIKDGTSEFKKEKLKDSNDIYNYVLQFYDKDINIYESFYLLMFNYALQVISYAKISQGGINTSTCDIRLIFKYALDNLATGIILVHNHPSGSIKPSRNDVAITKNIKKAGEIIQINLLDHLIITENDYLSFADEDML